MKAKETGAEANPRRRNNNSTTITGGFRQQFREHWRAHSEKRQLWQQVRSSELEIEQWQQQQHQLQ